MKVVILAGGFGARISEESHLKPKPMIEIGNMPILWHIMKIYSYYGFNEFIICCGYKGYIIKEYFAHYYLHNSDVTFDFSSENNMIIHSNITEPWKVTLVDTGLHTATGGRVGRIKKYINEDTFMLTYGDGVSNVNIQKLIEFHKKHKKIATITAVQPGARFGNVEFDKNNITVDFVEKRKENGGWINGGFMVLNKKVFDYINKGDKTIFEKDVLEKLSKEKKLSAYKHTGFWQCLDTMRDKILLDKLYEEGKAPWMIWKKNCK